MLHSLIKQPTSTKSILYFHLPVFHCAPWTIHIIHIYAPHQPMVTRGLASSASEFTEFSLNVMGGWGGSTDTELTSLSAPGGG